MGPPSPTVMQCSLGAFTNLSEVGIVPLKQPSKVALALSYLTPRLPLLFLLFLLFLLHYFPRYYNNINFPSSLQILKLALPHRSRHSP